MVELNYNFQYHPKHELIVIWQAKAACTIVNKMFFEEEGLLELALKHSNWIHDYRIIHSKNNKRILLGLFAPSSRCIQFVVNPYRRAVSSYIHMMIHKYMGIEHANLSFLEFIDRLIHNQIKSNIHHNKQTFYLNKTIEYVKMENIESRLPEINMKYGTHYTHKTSDHHAKTIKETTYFVGDLEWEKICNAIPQKYVYFYNDEIRKKVELLYMEDITNFKYTWEEFLEN